MAQSQQRFLGWTKATLNRAVPKGETVYGKTYSELDVRLALVRLAKFDLQASSLGGWDQRAGTAQPVSFNLLPFTFYILPFTIYHVQTNKQTCLTKQTNKHAGPINNRTENPSSSVYVLPPATWSPGPTNI